MIITSDTKIYYESSKEGNCLNMKPTFIGDVFVANQKMPWGKGMIAGDTIYLSGVDGCDPATGKFPTEVQGQAEFVFQKIKERLEDAGSDVDHIVRFVTYLVGRESLPGYRAARIDWFKKNSSHPNPLYAATLLFVSGLAEPEMLLEIDVTAVKK